MLIKLDCFCLENDHLKGDFKEDYYIISDKDVERNDPIFKFFKVLASEFINGTLEDDKCKSIYITVYIQTRELMEKNSNVFVSN